MPSWRLDEAAVDRLYRGAKGARWQLPPCAFADALEQSARRAFAAPPDTIATGHTQQLGAFLFRYHFVNIQLAGLLLTLAMIGAIMIARKRIVQTGDLPEEIALAESPRDVELPVRLGPAPEIEDNPHAIPVVGTKNPRQKVYPEN